MICYGFGEGVPYHGCYRTPLSASMLSPLYDSNVSDRTLYIKELMDYSTHQHEERIYPIGPVEILGSRRMPKLIPDQRVDVALLCSAAITKDTEWFCWCWDHILGRVPIDQKPPMRPELLDTLEIVAYEAFVSKSATTAALACVYALKRRRLDFSGIIEKVKAGHYRELNTPAEEMKNA